MENVAIGHRIAASPFHYYKCVFNALVTHFFRITSEGNIDIIRRWQALLQAQNLSCIYLVITLHNVQSSLKEKKYFIPPSLKVNVILVKTEGLPRRGNMWVGRVSVILNFRSVRNVMWIEFDKI